MTDWQEITRAEYYPPRVELTGHLSCPHGTTLPFWGDAYAQKSGCSICRVTFLVVQTRWNPCGCDEGSYTSNVGSECFSLPGDGDYFSHCQCCKATGIHKQGVDLPTKADPLSQFGHPPRYFVTPCLQCTNGTVDMRDPAVPDWQTYCVLTVPGDPSV